jgi:AcrR family transcriptional regulator
MCARIVDKEAKRREILLAATQVVARHGIRTVKIADIAVAAGVGKGTIYEYFSSKEEIYGAIIREYLDRAETVAAKKMFRARAPREKIAALLTGWLETTENESGDFLRLFIDVWSEAIRQTSSGVAEVFDLKSYFHEYRAFVAAVLQEGIDAGDLRSIDTVVAAGSLLALFDGIMLQWLLDPDHVDVRKAIDTTLDIIWNGISAA